MRTRRQQIGSWMTAGLVGMLVIGCAQQPVNVAPTPAANGYWTDATPDDYGALTGRGSAFGAASMDFQSAGSSQYTRVEEMIAGRVPGLQVTRRADGMFSLRVRGSGSVDGGGEPLLVVDDMKITGDPGLVLAMLSPRDVRRIDVLKDAGSTAIYGSRGANGVVLVSTWRHKDP